MKDWFLDLVAIQRERLGRNYIATFRHPQLKTPHIFGGMNVPVPKRWKCSDEKLAFGSGSAERVPDAVYTVLHEILKAATSKVTVSTSVQPLVNKELEKLGFGLNPGSGSGSSWSKGTFDLWKVPLSRCYNYDETSVCLLPLGTRGRKDKKEQAMAATDGKLQCTVGLAISVQFGLP